jgi:hypothetical protein
MLALSCSGPSSAASGSAFQFESIKTLNDMATFVRERFPLGSSRNDLRRTFVTEGHATLKANQNEADVEKYIYDIDLCSYYIWRWNVSSDYDRDGRLLQAYVNGNIVFPDGKPKKMIPKVAEEGRKASILRVERPRLEAYKGEKSLGFILFDRDSDTKTTNDQAAIGAGPSRADPFDFGKMITYTDVDPWRSIFDSDSADRIVPFQGDCAEVDRRVHAH